MYIYCFILKLRTYLRIQQPDTQACHHKIRTNGSLTLKIQGSYIRVSTVLLYHDPLRHKRLCSARYELDIHKLDSFDSFESLHLI